jgi:hypothetical protein
MALWDKRSTQYAPQKLPLPVAFAPDSMGLREPLWSAYIIYYFGTTLSPAGACVFLWLGIGTDCSRRGWGGQYLSCSGWNGAANVLYTHTTINQSIRVLARRAVIRRSSCVNPYMAKCPGNCRIYKYLSLLLYDGAPMQFVGHGQVVVVVDKAATRTTPPTHSHQS